MEISMTHQEIIENILIEENVSLYGFGDLDGKLPTDLKTLNSGISFAIRLSDFVMDQIHDKPTHSYFHLYRTVNAYIDRVSLRMVLKLNELGYDAFIVPASQSINGENRYFEGIYQHRTAATVAGIGWIGKNSCLITDEFGPRVRLGTVLTNMKFNYSEAIVESKCGDCDLCVKACPAIALVGDKWNPEINRFRLVDPKACSEYMNSRFKMIGRGSVCGICVKTCPRGTKRK